MAVRYFSRGSVASCVSSGLLAVVAATIVIASGHANSIALQIKPGVSGVNPAYSDGGPYFRDLNTRQARSHREGRKHRGERGKRQRGALPPIAPCTECQTLDGYVPMSEIADEIRIMVGKTRGVDKARAVRVQRSRGATETGLKARFVGDASCPEIDSEQWAIDYSHKRPWPAIHKGVDIPQPRGTPVRAIAAGMVVGRFENAHNRKGIEVMIRHSPDQTGLPFWTYSQYTHLREMSPLKIGEVVRLGQEIGNTGNSGVMGRRIRRDALHFAIIYSEHPEWSNDGIFVVPRDGYWMDPNAFYRDSAPYDSRSLAALPPDAKSVSVPLMTRDGSFMPADTKRIWPYPCAG